jgi:hypothetical protein
LSILQLVKTFPAAFPTAADFSGMALRECFQPWTWAQGGESFQ